MSGTKELIITVKAGDTDDTVKVTYVWSPPLDFKNPENNHDGVVKMGIRLIDTIKEVKK